MCLGIMTADISRREYYRSFILNIVYWLHDWEYNAGSIG